MKHSSWKGGLGAVITVGLLASPIAALPAYAAPNGVVINEAYVNGGSANAPYLNKFVELHNTTSEPVDISGWSLQYRAAGSTGAPTGVSSLSGIIPANGYYLIGGSSNADNGVALPATDATIGASFAGGGGTLILSNGATAVDPLGVGSVVDNPAVEDLLGYGSSNTFETAVAPKPDNNSDPRSLNRTDFVDTNNNSVDFTLSEAVTPTNAAGESGAYEPEPEPEPPTAGEVVPIAEIQGTTDTSPFVGDTLTTRGVVTAAYPTGGIDGYVIQTEGTGATTSEARTASDGIFVYSPGTVNDVEIGDHVEVTGAVSENFGVTQIEVIAGAASVLTEPAEEVKSLVTPWPETDEERELLESMLIRPDGEFTVSDNYDLNRYGEIDLAAGPDALVQPTEVAPPGTPENLAVQATNSALGVTLDDGATVDFVQNMDLALPYLTVENPVRVNGTAAFTSDVIVDFDFGVWRFQPVTQLTAENAETVQPVTFAGERPATPVDVGGDIKIASFNVLNYFSTTGAELEGCTYFNDRAGNPITVRGGCDARGAANIESLERQEAKIVDALTNLDADMVSLEEIENSAAFGKDRDEALATLTAALNEAEPGVWDYVPSPAEIPANEDVIRNAFIYKTAAVETVGESVILDDDVAFSNARKPLAQAFQAAGGDESTKFLTIVNHFKSKGSGSGENADQGDGQGASNADRVEQATALVAFADTMQEEAGTEKVFLTGDFNSYSAEDPMQVFYEAGYINQGLETGKYSYVFGGQSGSLDHILASPEADTTVTGVDIWNINAVESLALEYSRFNYTPVNYYAPDQYRASDHDPVIVGLDLDAEVTEPSTTAEINLLNINDFHGRINSNTVKFAGTVEQLREAAGEENTLFLSAGDNIGASLYASSSQGDVPTIDVLNALELSTSAVGNHEFDGGFADLTDRVEPLADFSYLGANVYTKGTEDPAMDEYDIFTVDGVDVAVIGAVTVETPTLVSPGGIADLDFGDPVEAVNRVAQEIEDAGLADVIIAEFHAGADGSSDDSAVLPEIIPGSEFEAIVNETTPLVDAIFNGHTHSFYASDAPVPGEAGETRPIVQTGSYGEFIGQIELTVDIASGDVLDYEARNVPRTTVDDATLATAYPRVAEVQTIVNQALQTAEELGSVVLGKVTDDITTAFVGDARDDRTSESTLGNLVADSLLSSLTPADRGGAEIGVANAGGLRAELYYDENGDVTVAEANAVLPFLNNLWTTTLTGEQFTELLEQQWPREGGSRTAFAHLGLSDNVTYTYDSAAVQGSRITSVSIDGEPLDPARDYRIGTFSFLAQGGDDFPVFGEGTGTLDSGLVDRDAWFDYIEANSPLSPTFDRRAVAVQDAPETVAPGQEVAFDVSRLDLTSLGSPTNTSIVLSYSVGDGDPVEIDTYSVTDGAARIAFTVPADAFGATFRLNAPDSGTMVRLPIGVELVEFTDIEGNEHQDHIEWMAENGLATGWLEADGTRTYRPLSNINRDAMAAFLYRLAGEPAYRLPAESPFSDIDFPADEADRVEHFDAIMWMHATGLSTGWPEADGTRTFRPVTPVNRDAMAAFMKRFAGQICLDEETIEYVDPSGAPFSDVPEGKMFEEEISWMKDNGISEGWRDGTYRPVTPVARDAMAAFVNRFDDTFGSCGR